MSFTTVEVECTGCKNKLKRQVEPIHPSKFTDPDKARMKSFFWCPHCGTVLGVYYLFEEVENSPGEARVVVGNKIDVADWVREQPTTRSITVRPRAKRPTRSS